MIDRIAIMAATAALALSAPPVAAQDSGATPLSTCMTAHSSPADQHVMIRWIFAVMTASATVQDLAKVSAAQREALSHDAGVIMSRLLTVDCRAEAVATIKLKGGSAIDDAFGVLGESAMGELMKDPDVQKALVGILGGVDMRAWASVLIDGGANLGSKKR